MTWWHWLAIVWLAFLAFMLLIGRARMVRKERAQARGRVAAAKHGWWRWRWSQDGWVRQCKICSAIQYGGDDYDGGPDDGGRVVSAR